MVLNYPSAVTKIGNYTSVNPQINLSSLPNYQLLTSDNFLIVATGGDLLTLDGYGTYHTPLTIIKSYNSATGILSVTNYCGKSGHGAMTVYFDLMLIG